MEPRRRINLLPPEIGEKLQQRNAWKFAIAILVAIVVILGMVTAYQMVQAKSVKQKDDKKQQEVTQLEAKNRDLDYLDQLEEQFKKQKEKVQSAWKNEVSWAKVLQEIAAVMPDGVYLTAFQGTSGDDNATKNAPMPQDVGASAQKPTAPPVSPQPGKLDLSQKTVLGQIQITGTGKGHREVGNWLYRVNRGMPSLSLSWITSSQSVTASSTGSTAPVSSVVTKVNFQGTAYLTPYSMGWMGRCAALGFDNLSGRPEGTCGHSYYGGGTTSSGSKTTTTSGTPR